MKLCLALNSEFCLLRNVPSRLAFSFNTILYLVFETGAFHIVPAVLELTEFLCLPKAGIKGM